MSTSEDSSPTAVMRAMNLIQSTKGKYMRSSYDRTKGKFLALGQHRFWPWGMERQDGFTHGEDTNREAEDPSDYSVSQFIDTDEDDDDDDDATGKHKISSKYQEGGHDNFSQESDEV